MELFRLLHKWRQALWQIPAILIVAGMLAFAVNSLRKEALPLFGDWSVDARMTTVGGDRLDIALDEAVRLFQDKAVVFIDARSAADYERGHIQGALNLPWQDIDRFFTTVGTDLPVDKLLIAYCDGETCNLSHNVAVFLRDMGFENVKVLTNGWTLWRKAGLPIISKDSTSTSGDSAVESSVIRMQG